ncbi:MAG: hypothetical protein ATN33_01395 [Epulopiscium sp. Nele67-Bin001]|nr:MAG: hypothetical protein ATN33_01395 [Epulopiscium sp. Nele67-Bin001]
MSSKVQQMIAAILSVSCTAVATNIYADVGDCEETIITATIREETVISSPISSVELQEVLKGDGFGFNEDTTAIEDLKAITANGAHLCVLDNLTHALNLEKFIAKNNNIVDLSPLSNLPDLKIVDVTNNDINILNLVGFASLKELHVKGNNISRIISHTDGKSLASIGIQELDLSENNLGGNVDAGALSGFSKSEIAAIRMSAPLEGLITLTELTSLNISGNKNLSDLTGVETLSKLTSLTVDISQMYTLIREIKRVVNKLPNPDQLTLYVTGNNLNERDFADNMANWERVLGVSIIEVDEFVPKEFMQPVTSSAIIEATADLETAELDEINDIEEFLADEKPLVNEYVAGKFSESIEELTIEDTAIEDSEASNILINEFVADEFHSSIEEFVLETVETHDLGESSADSDKEVTIDNIDNNELIIEIEEPIDKLVDELIINLLKEPIQELALDRFDKSEVIGVIDDFATDVFDNIIVELLDEFKYIDGVEITAKVLEEPLSQNIKNFFNKFINVANDNTIDVFDNTIVQKVEEFLEEGVIRPVEPIIPANSDGLDEFIPTFFNKTPIAQDVEDGLDELVFEVFEEPIAELIDESVDKSLIIDKSLVESFDETVDESESLRDEPEYNSILDAPIEGDFFIKTKDNPLVVYDGSNSFTIVKGNRFIMPAVTGDIRLAITCDGLPVLSVDTEQIGTYILTYTAVSPSGNVSYKEIITVRVVEDEEIISYPKYDSPGLSNEEIENITIKLDFSDVPQMEWYYSDIVNMYSQGLMDGVTESEFFPHSTVTRAEVASILHRIGGGACVQPNGLFNDVESNSWYANSIAWGSNMGIYNGFEDESFRPNEDITREQVITMVYNYAISQQHDVSNSNAIDSFNDSELVSDWANGAMQWAVGSGIVGGCDYNYLNPQGNATRAEISAIINRFLVNSK